GSLAGIGNTDWSWASLFADFDNDGYKDLFVTNGYVRDYTNMDFMKFMVDYQTEVNATGKELPILELIGKMPSSELTNYIFRNNGDLTFTPKIEEWGMDRKNISAGAAYVDLDNDGDLDLVVNNVNDFASVYQNNSEVMLKNNYIRVRLKGISDNVQALGARVELHASDLRVYREHYTSRGYESTVDDVIHFGLGKRSKVDSIVVVWPDGRRQTVKDPVVNSITTVTQTPAAVVKNESTDDRDLKLGTTFFTPVSNEISFLHRENDFNDFNVQRLLPHFLSRFGPCLAKGDADGDGLEDIF